jgi:hypothetical protein
MTLPEMCSVSNEFCSWRWSVLCSEDNDVYILKLISITPLGRFWQEPEPSQATGMALARCILGKFLAVVYHGFPLPLDVPTFAARCIHVPTNASAPSSER